MEPMTKAPKADEKPSPVASATMPKHSPMEMMSRVSSLMSRLLFLKKVGKT